MSHQKSRQFVPILVGGDNNTYGMARAFHEAYGVTSVVIGQKPTGPCYNSKIIDYRLTPKSHENDGLLTRLDELAQEFSDKKRLLIATGDISLKIIIGNKKSLERKFIVPYVDEPLFRKLYNKTSFYELCDKYGLDRPQTFICSKKTEPNYKLGFDFPVIVKPSNQINHSHHSFEGQKKLYKITTRAELDTLMEKTYDAGYEDTMIIQEWIPGDDVNVRTIMLYCDKNMNVNLLAMARVLLDSHTPWGVGSHTGLVPTYNKKLLAAASSFLKNVNYTGLGDFDLKYDPRDGKIKFLELNVRQGRSHYYVTASGANLAERITEDYVFGAPMEKKIVKDIDLLWLVVPIGVLMWQVRDWTLRKMITRLWLNGKMVNPLFYRKDLSLKRWMFLIKLHYRHYYNYWKYGRPLN